MDMSKRSIKMANNIVAKALKQFQVAVDKIDRANEVLSNTISKCDEDIKKYDEKIEKKGNDKFVAKKMMENNEKLRNKLSDFIIND